MNRWQEVWAEISAKIWLARPQIRRGLRVIRDHYRANMSQYMLDMAIFGVTATKVEVDPLTGDLKIERVDAYRLSPRKTAEDVYREQKFFEQAVSCEILRRETNKTGPPELGSRPPGEEGDRRRDLRPEDQQP